MYYKYSYNILSISNFFENFESKSPLKQKFYMSHKGEQKIEKNYREHLLLILFTWIVYTDFITFYSDIKV